MNAYGTDQGFADYAEAHDYTVPAGNVAAARLRASVYIDALYGDRFVGTSVGGIAQDRAWPRSGVDGVSSSEIPARVEYATYEAALVELGDPGSLSAIIIANERLKRLKAGSVELEYADGGSTLEGAVPVLSIVEGILKPLLRVPMPAILVV